MSAKQNLQTRRLRGLITERSLRLYEGEERPVVSVTNHNGIQLASETFSRQVYSRDLANYKVVKPSWYAFNPSRVNVGSLARNDLGYEVCVSPMYTVFELTSPEIDPDYFRCFILSNGVRRRVQASLQGSVRDSLSFNALESFSLILPSLEEQSAIAEIVSAIDKVIKASEVSIDAMLGLREAIVFGNYNNNGDIPEINLAKIAKSLDAGAHVDLENRPKISREIGVIKTSAASFGIFDQNENRAVKTEHISRVKTSIKSDRIIISRINTPDLVGASVYVDRDFPDLFLPDRLWQLDVKNRDMVDVRWLALLLASKRYRNQLTQLASGTSGSMKYLSKKLVLGLKLKLPTIVEQKRISAVAVALDKRLAASRNALQQLVAVRAVLVQELLSGRLRVPESMVASHRDEPARSATASPASAERVA